MSRKRQSPFEDVIDIASKLPWKVSCTLAVVSYLILHGVAGIKPSNPAGMGHMGDFVVKQMVVTIAMFGQFVLPFAFLVGALVSFFNAKKREKLYSSVEKSPDTDALFTMNWQEFEMLMEEYFRRRGYKTVRTGGSGADGGVDIVLNNNGETYLVQCKQWKAQRLGVQAVRELHGVMAARCAVGGFMVCAGKFTDEAKLFVENLNIKLFDGIMLRRMIREAKECMPKSVAVPVDVQAETDPSCPRCGSDMVRRVARQGGNAGREFWGCSSYPRCNGITSIQV